jgi:hypothetical protein
MSYIRYFIVRRQDAWVIKSNDEEFGPFPDHAEALLFATESAKKVSESGETAQVIWSGEMAGDGDFRHEWTYRQRPQVAPHWVA